MSSGWSNYWEILSLSVVVVVVVVIVVVVVVDDDDDDDGRRSCRVTFELFYYYAFVMLDSE
jgi:hypothetical protein